MSTEMAIVVVFLGATAIAGSLWFARQYERQQAASGDLQRQAEALQNREAALLERWETLAARLENITSQLERRSSL